MTPLEYLRCELENVSNTLDETLRHDYGAPDAEAYYSECRDRLDAVRRRIGNFQDRDPGIADQLAALANIANRVSLIERSHLGEFSWPFAETIRRIADKILAEKSLKGDLTPPIVHMIAEGTGYNIRNEKNPDATRKRSIAIVAFPRQLRHHVLMHCIFGHELGHAAFHSSPAGEICKKRVLPALQGAGPLQDETTLEEWLRSPSAPDEVRQRVSQAGTVKVQRAQVELWSLELMCDLFGILIFGAAFVVAHRMLLEPATHSAYDLELKSPTHPPLAVRRRTLVAAMRLLGLDKPATVPEDGPAHQAELAMLNYAMEDTGDPWPTMFADVQLQAALDEMKRVFDPDPSILAMPPQRVTVTRLLGRLSKRLPPILEEIGTDGVARQDRMTTSDCLYAGWAYWFGRDMLSPGAAPDFLRTNQLCDQALLQQRAIDLVLEAPK